MEKLAFDLISPSKKSRFDISISQKFFYSGLLGLLLFLFFLKIYDEHTGVNLLHLSIFKLVGYALCISLMIGTIYALFDKNSNNTELDGIITFDENQITLNHIKIYELDYVTGLKFSITDYKGRMINIHSGAGDPINSFGGDNFVEFDYKNKKYKYQFIVNSEAHGKLLTEKTIPLMRSKTTVKY